MHVSDCFYSVVVQAVASSILIAVSVASSMPKRDNTLSDCCSQSIFCVLVRNPTAELLCSSGIWQKANFYISL